MNFDGILFFPVTPFDPSGRVSEDVLWEHVSSHMPFSPGGVFPACGTGEYPALSIDEVSVVVRRTVEAVNHAVPVVSGAGGPLGHAIASARAANDAGADALLVLPPYLVSGPQAGAIAYVETIATASDLPVIVYHRANGAFTVDSVRALLDNPKVIGFKDGVGDVGLAQQFVSAVIDSGRTDFRLFNGLLTAELTQSAYRALGIPSYSSAVFAMAPSIASSYYHAYVMRDENATQTLLREFYIPFVQLRDKVPGFAVSLIKAGLRLGGTPVGSVRPPLIDPDETHLAALARLLEHGRAIVRDLENR